MAAGGDRWAPGLAVPFRALAFALSALLGLLAGAAPAHALRSIPVTSGAVHVWQDQLPDSMTDAQVRFVKGWFSETLPKLDAKSFAIIRLDGDLYESTMDALQALYPRLSPGGFVVVDDYALRSSRTAVHDYLGQRAEAVRFERIDDYSVWWQKAR